MKVERVWDVAVLVNSIESKGVPMSWGRSDPPKAASAPYPVTLHVGGEPVRILLPGVEHRRAAVWAHIATNMQGQITGATTADGKAVVINWSQVQAVTYDEPEA
ncbi:hypothetical protein GCM10028781_18720 [Nostocoides australiense]